MATLVFKQTPKPSTITDNAMLESVKKQVQELSGKGNKKNMEYTILNATTKEAYDDEINIPSEARQPVGIVWEEGRKPTTKDGVLVECHNLKTGRKQIRKFGFAKV